MEFGTTSEVTTVIYIVPWPVSGRQNNSIEKIFNLLEYTLQHITLVIL